MNTVTVSEEAFYEMHERLISENKRIIRCLVTSIPRKGTFYTLTWI